MTMSFTPFDLTGKVALVTGGNGGIGLGMAEGLARAGAKVVIWGLNPEKNETASAKLKAVGGEVLIQRVDVSDEPAVVARGAEAIETMGRVGFRAPTAGVGGGAGPFSRVSSPQGGRGSPGHTAA